MSMNWESLRALNNIRKMFRDRSTHGVVDVLNKYPLLDVFASIMALANLQKIVLDDHLSKIPDMDWNDPNMLRDLPHYANFATAAYGWKMDLAMEGRLHVGDLNTLLARTGLQEDDVVAAQWRAQTNRPAYFIVREHSLQRLVLCIRGTNSTHDVLTDLCCVAEDFDTGAPGRHRAHEGILKSARELATMTEDIVARELEANPLFSLVVAGHSLGGGVAAVLGALWDTRFPRMKVYCYGTPCVSPMDSKPTIDKHIVSVVVEGDPFSSISLGHVADASKALAHLCENRELRSAILTKTGIPPEQLSAADLLWFHDTMDSVRLHMTAEKMLPSGRIIYLQPQRDGSVSSKELNPEFFLDPRVHIRMFDFSKHLPSVYETLLAVLCAEWEDRHYHTD